MPCYNEAQRFPIDAFRAYLSRHTGVKFLFVNDGSTDDTLCVFTRLQNEFAECVEILNESVNAGKGEAVRKGMLYALDCTDAAVIGFWDADLATPLDAILDLLAELDKRPQVQMVFGSRVKLLGREVERLAARHYLGRIFATVVSMELRLPIYDTQCGAKLFRASPELRAILAEPLLSRWVFDVELLARFIQLRKFDMESVKAAIYEYPLHAWRDMAGSKVRPRDFVKALVDITRIYFRYLRRP